MSQRSLLARSKNLLAVTLLWQLSLCSTQNFDPMVDDQKYLDKIQNRLQQESMTAHYVLVNQTKVLQQVTRTFIESKIKENLFKAVRERVELELEEMAKTNVSTTPTASNSSSPSSRQARQDEDEDEDTVARVTVPPRTGLLPQLANVVTTLFGSEVNVTGYLQEATSFLPQDLSTRIVNAASLIDPNRFTSTTPQPQLIINGQVIPQSAFVNGTYTYNPEGAAGQQAATFTQQNAQNLAAAIPIPQSVNVNSVSNNGGSVGQVNSPNSNTPDVSTFVPQPSILGPKQRRQPQQNALNNNAKVPYLNQNGDVQNGLVAPSPLAQPGTVLQEPYNLRGNDVVGPYGVRIQSSPQLLTNPVPNFKVNDALLPALKVTTSSAISNEDDDYDTSSSEKKSKTSKNEQDSAENDLPLHIVRADLTSAEANDDDLSIQSDDPIGSNNLGYLDEYPAVKYAIKLFNHFASRDTVPTTTEFVPVTTFNASLVDYVEEEEGVSNGSQAQKAVSQAPNTYKRIAQGGVVIFEGAKEAYNLLQKVSSYFDKIGNRLDQAGYGPEDVGIELSR